MHGRFSSKWIQTTSGSGLAQCPFDPDVTNTYSVSSVDRPSEIQGKVELSADGSEAEPCSSFSDFHLSHF